jgi:hypothetical protein
MDELQRLNERHATMHKDVDAEVAQEDVERKRGKAYAMVKKHV